MAGGDHVVGHHHVLSRAHAAQRHEAFAILRRLDGVSGFQLARGPGNLAHGIGHELQGLRFVDAPGNHQHGVIGLVILVIEGLRAGVGHAFQVVLRSDDRLAVVVPDVGGGGHALAEDGGGLILAALQFVAHHGHFGVENLLVELDVDHAVGFQAEGPLQILVTGAEGLVVVGAVVGGGAVPVRSVRGDFVLDMASVGGSMKSRCSSRCAMPVSP
jgi:hypothetical protein